MQRVLTGRSIGRRGTSWRVLVARKQRTARVDEEAARQRGSAAARQRGSSAAADCDCRLQLGLRHFGRPEASKLVRLVSDCLAICVYPIECFGRKSFSVLRGCVLETNESGDHRPCTCHRRR